MDKHEYRKICEEKPGYVMGCMIFTERVSNMPNCNTCGKKISCEYVPRLGDDVRFNCPLWEIETKKTPGLNTPVS